MTEQFLCFIDALSIGTLINKPDGGTSRNLGWSKDGESLVYSIGHKSKGYVKKEDFRLAVAQLDISGSFTKKWWENCKQIQSYKPCNFTTIGGLMEMFGVAKYGPRGTYKRTSIPETDQHQTSLTRQR